MCNCCVSAVPPDYFVAYSLLEYAQKRLELYFVNVGILSHHPLLVLIYIALSYSILLSSPLRM